MKTLRSKLLQFSVYNHPAMFLKETEFHGDYCPNIFDHEFGWIMKYPTTFVEKVPIGILWKKVKPKFKRGYEFLWFYNSLMRSLYIIELKDGLDEYVVVSSFSKEADVYPLLIEALSLIEDFRVLETVQELEL